jgi:hypothetical protein
MEAISKQDTVFFDLSLEPVDTPALIEWTPPPLALRANSLMSFLERP